MWETLFLGEKWDKGDFQNSIKHYVIDNDMRVSGHDSNERWIFYLSTGKDQTCATDLEKKIRPKVFGFEQTKIWSIGAIEWMISHPLKNVGF